MRREKLAPGSGPRAGGRDAAGAAMAGTPPCGLLRAQSRGARDRSEGLLATGLRPGGLGRPARLLGLACVLGALTLVRLPFLAHRLPVVGSHLLELAEARTRGVPLLGCEADPLAHAPLEARLVAWLHRRVALGDAEPLLLAGGIEFGPFVLNRGGDLLLLGSELTPGRGGL